MSNKRNSYLVSKAMKNFMIAAILAMVAQSLNVTIDGIIVSHLIGPNALSAINIFSPIAIATSIFYYFISAGLMILAPLYLGERDYLKFNKTLGSSIVLSLVVGVLIIVGVCAFKQPLFDFICPDESLRPFFYPYATIMLVSTIIIIIASLADTLTCIGGNPKLSSKSILVSAAVNIVLDYVFVAWFNMGIAGSAYASVIAVIVGFFIVFGFVYKENKSAWLNPFKYLSFKAIKDSVVQGVPMAFRSVVMMLFLFFVNSFIIEKQGPDGMFVWSICINLLSFGMLMMNGVGSTVMAIGPFLQGQKDFSGLNALVHKCTTMLVFVVLIIIIAIQLCPQFVSILFGADTPELIAYSNTNLRIFVWYMAAVLFSMYLSNVYQMLGYMKLSSIVILFYPVILVISMFMMDRYVGSDSIWYAFPQTGLFVMILLFVSAELYRIKKSNLTHITLVPNMEIKNTYDVSIGTNIESLKESLSGLIDYLEGLGFDMILTNRVNLCLEELMLNIVENSGRGMKNHFMDVHITIMDDTLMASIKDDGKPFNPTILPKEDRSTSIAIAFGTCDKLEYKYMYGQNMTYTTWYLKK